MPTYQSTGTFCGNFIFEMHTVHPLNLVRSSKTNRGFRVLGIVGALSSAMPFNKTLSPKPVSQISVMAADTAGATSAAGSIMHVHVSPSDAARAPDAAGAASMSMAPPRTARLFTSQLPPESAVTSNRCCARPGARCQGGASLPNGVCRDVCRGSLTRGLRTRGGPRAECSPGERPEKCFARAPIPLR